MGKVSCVDNITFSNIVFNGSKKDFSNWDSQSGCHKRGDAPGEFLKISTSIIEEDTLYLFASDEYTYYIELD